MLCLVDPWSREEPRVEQGICEGAITRTPRGLGGFGYDPLFVVDGKAVTKFENKAGWHHRVPTDEEYNEAILELNQRGILL